MELINLENITDTMEMDKSKFAANHSSNTQPQNASRSIYKDNNLDVASSVEICRDDSNWQSSYETLAERMSFLLNNETLSDVTFLVGLDENNRQRIAAHRFILSIGSCVFNAMLNGNFTEQGPIIISDSEPQVFLLLLRFLYTDNIQISPDTVITTLYLAKKYSVLALEKLCVEFLHVNLSSENACMLLMQSLLFDEPALADRCMHTIDKNAEESFSVEGFIELDVETLCKVIRRDTLLIKESSLFTALLLWAKEKCQQQNLEATSDHLRNILGEAIQCIRYPLMSIEEFASEVAQTCILNNGELVEMFLYYTVKPKPSISYNTKPRAPLETMKNQQVISRFSECESRWGYNGVSDRIRFSVNRRISISGFGLYGSVNIKSDYSVKLQILISKSLKVIAENNVTFVSNGTTEINQVFFKKPVEISQDTVYLASCMIKGADSYYGIKGLRKILHSSSMYGKVTFSFMYTAGQNNGSNVCDGQIPEIYFSID